MSQRGRRQQQEDCAICLGHVRQAVCLPCSHVFCRICLARLRQEEAACGHVCPLCRQPMSPSSPQLAAADEDSFEVSPQSPEFLSPVTSPEWPAWVEEARGANTPTGRRLADRVTPVMPQPSHHRTPTTANFTNAPTFFTRRRRGQEGQQASGITSRPASELRRQGQGQHVMTLSDQMAELGRQMSAARGDGRRMMEVGLEMLAVGRQMGQDMGRMMTRQMTSLFDSSDWLYDIPAYGGNNSYFSLHF